MTIIYGNGGLAREVVAATNWMGAEYLIMADDEYARPGELKLSDFRPQMGKVVIAVGDPHDREKMYDKLTKKTDYTFLINGTYLAGHEWPVSKGIIVQPGAIVMDNVMLCPFVIVNINATIGHDSVIGPFTTISPGANISGRCIIGPLCHIGSNAVIREGVTICDDVTIGMGAIVTKDITQPGVYVNDVKLRRL